MYLFLLTLDTIMMLNQFKLLQEKYYFNFKWLASIFSGRCLNILSIKIYQPYPKSTKIDAL